MNIAVGPFRAIYHANHERVRRMLSRIVDPQDAEDLTQTVFANAAKALPTFRGDAEASTWLHRIAANVASDWLRSRATKEAKLTIPLPDAADDETPTAAIEAAEVNRPLTPEQLVSQHEMRDCIRGEIGKLPEAQRIVLML